MQEDPPDRDAHLSLAAQQLYRHTRGLLHSIPLLREASQHRECLNHRSPLIQCLNEDPDDVRRTVKAKPRAGGSPMAERLIQEGMRLRSLEAAAGEGRCGCARATRYSPATCLRIAIISLSSSMHSSSVISMPQFACIAGSFAHVTRSPCPPEKASGYIETIWGSPGAPPTGRVK